MRKSFLYPALLFVLSVLIQSCIGEDFNSRQGIEGVETEVSISISVPYSSMITTRSLTKDNEETVNTIQLLVFNTSGKYLYTSNGSDITVDTGNTDVRNFSAVLKTGTVDIVVLANCREIITDCFPSGIEENVNKQTIIDQLTLAITNKWITDTSDNDYLHIPMWGEIGTHSITPATTQIGNAPFDIHRMIARVDVTTSSSVATDFKLTSVRLYYYNDRGSVIPDESDFNSDTPSIPANATRVKGPIVYEGSSLADDANGNPACIREIYLFEAAAGNRFTHPENTCLVVGGEYKGIAGFYRIDFQQTTSSGKKYLDILRNHNYQVIITSVEDVGFKDPEEALEAFPVNINSQVISWVENSRDDISIGGNYILKLSTDELVFSPTTGTQYMYIYTNHPQGWKFVRDNFVPEVDWLTITPVKGTQGNFTEVKVTVDENTDTGMRIYEIPLLVDNVTKQILFAQRGTGDVDLEVFATPNPILIGKYPTEPITINVSTYPAGIPLYFNYEGDIQWEAVGGLPADGTTDRVLSLQPKGNDTDNVLTGFLTIYVKDAAGHTASCVVEIQQVTKITGLDTQLYNPYSEQPGTYKFRLESTVPWQVNYISDGSIWTSSFGTGIQNASSWADYNFALSGNPGYADRSVEVSFYAPDTGEYETVEFVQGFKSPAITSENNTIFLPAESGQKVTHKFKANADWTAALNGPTNGDWTRMYSTFNGPTTGTGEGWNMAEYTFELQTNDLPATNNSAAPKAGQHIYDNAITVTLNNHTPVGGTYSMDFTVVREVPPNIYFSTTVLQYRSIHYGTPYNYSGTYTAASTTSDPSFYNFRIPAGEHVLPSITVPSNTSFEYWLESNPSDKRTYTLSASSNPGSFALSPNFVIPANTSVADRLVRICFQPIGYSKIFYLNLEQRGTQGISLEIISPAVGTTFPTGGGEIEFRIKDPNNVMTSTLNNVVVTLRVGGRYVELGSANSGVGSHSRYTAPGIYTLWLEPNRLAPFEVKDVELVWGISISTSGSTSNAYSALGATFSGGKWKQDYKSHKLNSGHYIARGNIQSFGVSTYTGYYYQPLVNWTTALGIEDTYLTNTFFANSSQWLTYSVRNDLASDAFSCATYTEPDMPNMKWRVPTLAEMKEIYGKKETIGGFVTGSNVKTSNYYWTVEETAASTATMIDMDTGNTTNASKNLGSVINFVYYKGRIRCVSRTTTIP